jgi:hypothetical protein
MSPTISVVVRMIHFLDRKYFIEIIFILILSSDPFSSSTATTTDGNFANFANFSTFS